MSSHSESDDIKAVAILGASGYTGAEALRLALSHPRIKVTALGAERKAGKRLQSVFSHFHHWPDLPELQASDAIDFAALDAVFVCLPHAASQNAIVRILDQAEKKGDAPPLIIDLSADFRLKDAEVYQEWYATRHIAPHLLPQVVYGLSEFAHDRLPGAKIIACPGCYPTACLISLLPLARQKLIRPSPIIIAALSGVSGRGRSLTEDNLFSETAEAMQAYGLDGHRHRPEIEQELSEAFASPAMVSFIPHLIPINRGELATITVQLEDGTCIADLRRALEKCYREAPFVTLLPEGEVPSTRMVRGSNHAALNVFADRNPKQAVVMAAIDNLVKGSSGQAIQNFNIALGLPETMGLEQPPIFP